ncbi:NAD(P)/FAD-dependent oxidoreductase [Allokutzneria multivorans]|uniref:NAD(P)/FAD-dependent oxidoreductase n=1 Tax=Allokutzneria multivorans TaxID=1142134 RepID=A0ABP7QZB1_9PSEU
MGAGLAGLSAAEVLASAGVEVQVLEASDEVGGRVRTDVVDGYRLDRGFQILCPAYPEVRTRVDLRALQPKAFDSGVLVSKDGRTHALTDPRTGPDAWREVFAQRVLGAGDLAALAALAGRDVFADERTLVTSHDRATRAELARWTVSGAAVDAVLRPFLSGVFLEPALETSSRFFHLVLRSFGRAAPVLPAEGMAALPRQLAARLPEGTVRVQTPVAEVTGNGVLLMDGERVTADAVVVATDGSVAAALLPELEPPRWNAVTTWYFSAPEPPLRRPVLVLDGTGGPVVNTVVLSEVADTYAPKDRALIAASVLGAGDTVDEATVRSHLARLYGVDTGSWETVARYAIPRALPAMPAPHRLRKPVRLGDRRYVAGDHRDTSSIQGALVSGRRAARAVLADVAVVSSAQLR